MATFIFSFEGREHERKVGDYADVDEARNEAVRYLGAYLAEHPGFADEGHWRVNVSDGTGQSLLHVIVATVPTSRRTGDARTIAVPARAGQRDPAPKR